MKDLPTILCFWFCFGHAANNLPATVEAILAALELGLDALDV